MSFSLFGKKMTRKGNLVILQHIQRQSTKKLAKTGLIETLVLTAITILSESEIKSETIHKPIPFFLYDLVVILSIHDPNKMWRDTSPDVI